MRFTYRCNECGERYETDQILYRCPSCTEGSKEEFRKGMLIVDLNTEDLKALKEKEDLTFYDFLPYTFEDRGLFPLGPTPLFSPKRLIERYNTPNLTLKNESALPSGSFKDRASYLVALQALYYKENKIALASTGNAGAAMSCVGSAFGLEVILFVPKTAPVNKMMQSLLYGATVVAVDGTYDDAFELSLEYTNHFGGINRNTAYNPMTVEGKKSVSIELFLQMGKKVPDIIYLPVGDGCIYSGVCKGFFDLYEADLIEKVPHVVCVQSTSSNAISRGWRQKNFATTKASTIADSISVNSPANGRMALSYIDKSDSWCVEVSDQEILEAQSELALFSGLFVEPAAAAAWAGFKSDSENRSKRFSSEVNVCVLLTGIGFKDMAIFDDRVELPKPIENSLEAMIAHFS